MNLLQCLLTKNDCYKRGAKITPKGVMVHDTGAENAYIKRYVQPNVNGIGENKYNNDWNRAGVKKCVHAFIGKLNDGTIATVQTLPFNYRGWHGGGDSNNTHLSFEICRDIDDPEYFQLVYKEAVEFTAYLCKLYYLDPMQDGVVICHHEGYERGIASNHADVTEWFPLYGKTMDNFREDVKAAMSTADKDFDFNTMFNEYREKLRDNDAEDWSKAARDWATQNGFISGGDAFADGTPNYMWGDFVNREQLVTVLYAMHLKGLF